MTAALPHRVPHENQGYAFRSWLLGFRRITSSTRYLPEVDGLRFVALAFVFLFHLAGDILRHSPSPYRASLQGDALFWTTQRLNFGVQLFFVVSGFVLAVPFARHYLAAGPRVKLKAYFLRRVTRLEPPYILALLLFFALKVAGSRGSAASLMPHLAASLAYVHNLIYGTPSDINFVAWSLEIEVQFYLLAPGFAFLLFRTRSAVLRRIGIGSAILISSALPWLFPGNGRVGLSLAGQLAYFLAGMLLAEFYVGSGGIEGRPALWADILVLCSAGLITVLFSYPDLFSFAAPLAVFLGYWAMFRSRYFRCMLASAVISTIGGMCYSIYLLHNYVIATAGYLTEQVGAHASFEVRLLIQSVLIGPLVLVLSAVFYRIIERPCMDPHWPGRARRYVKGMSRVAHEAGVEV